MINDRLQIYGTPRENVTGGAVTITTDHEAIHKGWGFSAAHFAEGIADNGTLAILLTPPETGKIIHLKQWKPWGEGGLNKIEIFQAPTVTAPGTAITPANRERAFHAAVASTMTVAHTPTTTADGTRLDGPSLFGGGGAGGGSGGQDDSDQEIVLAPGIPSLVKLTNLSGAAKAMGIWLFWYEETY
jgi:hypothetical protein